MSRFKHHEEIEEEKVDISPLIDCVFILLIFFIVTTKFIDETGLEVENVQATPESASDEESETLIFVVTNAGGILHEGQRISLSSLRSTVREAVAKDDETPVIVRSEAKTRAVHFVAAIDAAYEAGAQIVTADRDT